MCIRDRYYEVPFWAKNGPIWAKLGPNLGQNINFQGRALKFAPEVWFHALITGMTTDFGKRHSKVPFWAKNGPYLLLVHETTLLVRISKLYLENWCFGPNLALIWPIFGQKGHLIVLFFKIRLRSLLWFAKCDLRWKFQKSSSSGRHFESQITVCRESPLSPLLKLIWIDWNRSSLQWTWVSTQTDSTTLE